MNTEEYGLDGELINPNNIKPGDRVVESLPIRSCFGHDIKCYETYPGIVFELNSNKNMAYVTHGSTGGGVSLNQLRLANEHDYKLGW